MRKIILSLALSVVFAFPSVLAQAESPPAERGRLRVDAMLQPSIATYRVTLIPGSSRQFVSAEGSFVDKSRLSCTGWNVEQRLYVKFMPPAKPGSPTIPVYLRTGANNFESLDGLTYQFEDKSSMGGQVISTHKGVATLTSVGGKGTAVYSDPADKTVDLVAGTIFPVGYSIGLIKAAGSGQGRYDATVFDGSMSAELGLIKMVSVISAPRAAAFKPSAPPASSVNETDYATQLAWNTRTRVFKASAPAGGQHMFEQGFSMLPTGRAEYMLMDFGQFKLRFDLFKYEEIPAANCQ